MGRKKLFDEKSVVDKIGKTFIKYGYEGTSLDDLVKETGILRGSLYSTFGSKRGMFIAALTNSIRNNIIGEQTLTLVIIAMLELTAKDNQILRIIKNWIDTIDDKDNLISLLGKTIINHSHVLEEKINGK